MNKMKSLFAFALLLPLVACAAAAEEISLFDREGTPAAYIDTSDGYTIYMWDGTPAAYLAESNAHNSLSIYGFNGKLLGWYVMGAVYDLNGKVSGFEKGCCPLYEPYTKYEPYKSYKKYKPYRSYREYEKYQPYLQRQWGQNLSLLLLGGR